jgi:alpha/beta hydrolase family protein
VPPESWCFARVEGGTGLDNQGAVQAVIPSDSHIHIPGGFEPGWIYELVYTGRDPLVLGLGHAAVRDFVSFLRYGTEDHAGRVNPLRERGGSIEKAYAWGRSQTGRCLRDFVYRGFNADADGRRVFDGILPHVAGAGRMWLNHRFANADVSGGQQYEDHFNPADSFPFSYTASTDHLTGRRDAILKRPDTDPLVIHTQTATEYWQRRGSLAHTDTRGNDLPQPPGVRIYMWASSQHFADPLLENPERGVCQNYRNTVATSMLFRAMIDAMDRWATSGIAPPDSRIPRRRRHIGPSRGVAATVSDDPGSGDAACAECVAAVGLRTGGGTRDLEGAARHRAERRVRDPGAGGRRRRQRHSRHPSAYGGGAARHMEDVERAVAAAADWGRPRHDVRLG